MSTQRLFLTVLLVLSAALLVVGCVPVARLAPDNLQQPTPADLPLTVFQLDANAAGYYERVDHIDNIGIAVTDPNPFAAEYKAGFIQGRLQKPVLAGTRDNQWDATALIEGGPDHTIPPSIDQMERAQALLVRNYAYTLDYITQKADPTVREQLTRILFRLLGVYHGAMLDEPAALDFSGDWLPALDTFAPAEVALSYGTPSITFMDLYYLNASPDLGDALAASSVDKCSAFVKRTDSDIFLTHNTWSSFLDQSMAVTYAINDTVLTFNAIYPGMIASSTDFGYNNHGIIFNETTHHNTYTEANPDALWMLWRAALAEQFASSLDEFYHLVSLEASGTYMNGYMIVDTKTREIGLVEMSYKSFVYFKSDGSGGYIITTKPEGLSTAYDPELVQPDVILGINFPASYVIRDELQADENRPARRAQFLARIDTVTDIESAKDLITYTDPAEPLSVFGRWDLGYGTTTTPKTVPDGSIDAKAIVASEIAYISQVKGQIDLAAGQPAFWMRFATAHIDGKPFIWSESQWKQQTLRHVPNVVDGAWQAVNMYIK